jgi:hypothetical protein
LGHSNLTATAGWSLTHSLHEQLWVMGYGLTFSYVDRGFFLGWLNPMKFHIGQEEHS